MSIFFNLDDGMEQRRFAALLRQLQENHVTFYVERTDANIVAITIGAGT